MEKPHKNTSLQAKSNARVAAVQLLYRLAMTGEKVTSEKLMDDYADFQAGNRKNPDEMDTSVPPNKAYLRKLLDGMEAYAHTLEPLVDSLLSGQWKRERMSPLTLAILKLGVFELDAHRTLSAHVLIDEYTTLASRFCDENEVGFVHAALFKMANELRGEHGRIQPD